MSLSSNRACRDKYDKKREAASLQCERAEARDARAREDLRNDLFEVHRWEDERYHERCFEGWSHLNANEELTQHDLEELHRELAQLERRSDDEEGEEMSTEECDNVNDDVVDHDEEGQSD